MQDALRLATDRGRQDEDECCEDQRRVHDLIVGARITAICYCAPCAAAPSSRSFAMSRVGALPKRRVYSRLNCDALR